MPPKIPFYLLDCSGRGKICKKDKKFINYEQLTRFSFRRPGEVLNSRDGKTKYLVGANLSLTKILV